MILITCALQAEALELINHFKLKQVNTKPFSIWKNDNIKLIITGIGKIPSAIGTTYISMHDDDKIDGFVNIGVAGHKNLEIGTAIIAQKITDKTSKKRFFPSFLFDIPFKSFDLITVEKIEQKFKKDTCYDMEASSFFETATKFTYLDLVHSIKIISDNYKKSFSKDKISNLFIPHLSEIENFINNLSAISKENEEKDIDFPKFFIEKWKFSITEQYKLKEVLNKIDALHPNIQWIEDEFSSCKTSKDVINYLEKKLKIFPIKFF